MTIPHGRFEITRMAGSSPLRMVQPFDSHQDAITLRREGIIKKKPSFPRSGRRVVGFCAAECAE